MDEMKDEDETRDKQAKSIRQLAKIPRYTMPGNRHEVGGPT